jgi:hypothetical protein
MPATYEPIATTTLGSATNTITFSSIPSTYTDLKISFVGLATANYIRTRLRFNGDTGNNYNFLFLFANGSVANTSNSSGISYIQADTEGIIIAQPSFYSFDILSYGGSTRKNCLITCSENKNGSGHVGKFIGMWNSTAAINSVTLVTDASTFAAGTIATIYGIKAA